MGYKLKATIKVSRIAELLGLEFLGCDVLIDGVAPSNLANSGFLTFSKSELKVEGNVAIITDKQPLPTYLLANGFIISENPRLDFIRALNILVKDIGFATWELPAEVHASVKVGNNVVIEKGCVVGENTIIEHNVVLHAGTRIGKNCLIRSNSSIGGDGFGFERLADDTPLRFPHLGGVVIGDNVEIGSCTAVARGTLSDTVIEDNVKVDNLVHIAHNCLIKDGAFIIACAELSGGVVVGKNAWVAPNSCTHQKITIGDGALVGLGAVVTKDVPARTIYAGNPAKKIRDI